MLHARLYGDRGGALPVVCLPGLSRNVRDFHQLALHFSTDLASPRHVIVLDYRGRGQSAWDPDPANYTVAVETGDVISACAALDIQKAIFIGTSRGGLILHILAALRPALIAGTVLNDIGPVIETAGLAQIRTYLLAKTEPANWDEAAGLLKATHGAAFPILADQDWNEMAEAIFTVKDGKIVADFDPALLDALKTMTLDGPLPDLWQPFAGLTAMPMMAIRGEHSTLLSQATFQAMQERHPDFRAVLAKGQGHAPILHHPDIAAELCAFIQAIG